MTFLGFGSLNHMFSNLNGFLAGGSSSLIMSWTRKWSNLIKGKIMASLISSWLSHSHINRNLSSLSIMLVNPFLLLVHVKIPFFLVYLWVDCGPAGCLWCYIGHPFFSTLFKVALKSPLIIPFSFLWFTSFLDNYCQISLFLVVEINPYNILSWFNFGYHLQPHPW